MVLQHALRAHRHRGNGAQDGFLRRPRRLLLRAVSGQRLRGQFCECLGEGPLQRAGVWPRGRFPAPELQHLREAEGREVGWGGGHNPRVAGEAPGSGAAVSAFRVGPGGQRAGAPLGCAAPGWKRPRGPCLLIGWEHLRGVQCRPSPARGARTLPQDPESGASDTQASRRGEESRSSPNAQRTPGVVPARGHLQRPGSFPALRVWTQSLCPHARCPISWTFFAE